MARAAVSRDCRHDWHAVAAARQAVRDAKDIRSRLHALLHYQGELMRFIDKHWVRVDQWADKQP